MAAVIQLALVFMSFVALTFAVDFARAATPLILIAEKRSIVGREQITARIDDAGLVTTTVNSNFLSPGTSPFDLGLKERSATKSDLEFSKELKSKIKADVTELVYQGPHELAVYVDSKRVSRASPLYGKVLAYLQNLPTTSGWKKVDVETVKIERSKISSADAKCEAENKLCRTRLGVIHLE
ncbi:MAG: hypothetical protein V4760_10650 [Bdellovibrionota bacterium]